MYDDFIDVRPGAAKELEHDLNAAIRERPAGAHADDKAGTEKLSIDETSSTSSTHQNPKKARAHENATSRV